MGRVRPERGGVGKVGLGWVGPDWVGLGQDRSGMVGLGRVG